jgi:hypothetical protein
MGAEVPVSNMILSMTVPSSPAENTREADMIGIPILFLHRQVLFGNEIFVLYLWIFRRMWRGFIR